MARIKLSSADQLLVTASQLTTPEIVALRSKLTAIIQTRTQTTKRKTAKPTVAVAAAQFVASADVN